MKTILFNRIIDSIDILNTLQFRLLKEIMQSHEFKNQVGLILETPFEKVRCPHCENKTKLRWGMRHGLQRYKCKSCKKTYNSLTGTPLARLRKKEQWLEYSACLKSGDSVRAAASTCEVHRNTSFKWRHRFLSNAKYIVPGSLNGIVEADETYFLRSEKGNKHLARKPRKRGGKALHRGLSKEQVCVLVCRDRNKNTFDKIFYHFNSTELKDALGNILSKDALFCSDSKSVYKKFTKDNHLRHGCLNLSKGERVKDEIVHIQNVNSYHERLKKWMFHFHGVSTKYLDSYLAWFRELDELSTVIIPETFLIRGKVGQDYKLLPLTMT